MSDVVEAGRDAWKRIKASATLADWIEVGRALLAARIACMAAVGINRPVGKRYSELMTSWLVHNEMGDLKPSERSNSIWLIDNLTEIMRWRARLDPSHHRRMVTPHTVRQAYLSATKPKVSAPERVQHKGYPKHPSDWTPSQEMIRFVAAEMRENWCNDVIKMAAIAAGAVLEFQGIEGGPEAPAAQMHAAA